MSRGYNAVSNMNNMEGTVVGFLSEPEFPRSADQTKYDEAQHIVSQSYSPRNFIIYIGSPETGAKAQMIPKAPPPDDIFDNIRSTAIW